MEILNTKGVGHALFAKDLSCAALGPKVERLGIGAVHRNSQLDGEIALHLRGVVRDQMRAVRIHDQRANVFNQPGPIEELLGERLCGSVEWRNQKEPLTSMPRE